MIRGVKGGVYKLKINKQKGFTLIELLVVIAVIGLLSSIVMVSLNTARMKARDAKRQSDIRQVSLAMEMYYDSQSPSAFPTNVAGTPVPAAIGTAIAAYLPSFPTDSLGTGTQQYAWLGNVGSAQNFCIYVQLESGGRWAVASEKGNATRTIAPVSFATCVGN